MLKLKDRMPAAIKKIQDRERAKTVQEVFEVARLELLDAKDLVGLFLEVYEEHKDEEKKTVSVLGVLALVRTLEMRLTTAADELRSGILQMEDREAAKSA